MPLVSLDDVAGKNFDYIVIGGGTAGLVLAAGLSEDPNTSVLVLDAGKDNTEEPLVKLPGQMGFTFTNPQYDWAFTTAPQEHANNNVFLWSRGKSFGGSSAMNFSVWTKPVNTDIDDWEKLGNPGWNWANYEKYCEKVTSYTPPTKYDEGLSEAMKVWQEPYGQGPLQLSHPKIISSIEAKVLQALKKKGIPLAPSPNLGETNGSYLAANVLDPSTNTRSFAATAFFGPNASRSNLSVLLSAYVCKILTSESPEGLVATGVEFSHGEDRKTYVVHANKEVILSAGALKSPQILELSGIGRPDILSSIGIPVKLPLETVGENVQEHQFVGSSWELKDGLQVETFDALQEPQGAEKHAKLFTEKQGAHMMGVINMTFAPLQTISPKAQRLIDTMKATVVEGVAAGKYPPGLVEQYTMQLERIEAQKPGCEIIGVPGFMSFPNPPQSGKKHYTFIAATNYNFSRGTIHATSNDPHADPKFDPHYFEHDIDLQTAMDIVKYIREITKTAPLNECFGLNVNPGPAAESDEALADWIKKFMGTTFHTAGSLSMLPHDKGGVVDPQLKVYGTKNIRVADMSIVPLHFSAHSQATAYVIGAQAAAIIKGEF